MAALRTIPDPPPYSILLSPTNIFLQLSVVSVGNSIQAYLTTSYSSQVYSGPSNPSKPATAYNPFPNSPVTPLSSRTFGTWTFISSVIRLYAAYYTDNPQIYQMAILTFVVAWFHFMGELVIFKTARWGKGLAGPATVSTVSIVWMLMQWGVYVE